LGTGTGTGTDGENNSNTVLFKINKISFCVTDPGSLSRITDTNCYLCQISDPKITTKEEEGKIIVLSPLNFVFTNFPKLKTILFLNGYSTIPQKRI
jgi:hypothetical protein